jgi:hypothetical protein
MNKIVRKNFYRLFFLLIVSSTCFAQSPGGVSTNLVGWFKANLGTTGNTDNAVVSSWADQAGTAQNLTQGTNNQRPIFNTDASNVNSNPYVRFDGANDMMTQTSNTDFNNFTSDQRSIVVVFRTGANVTNTQVLYEEGGGTTTQDVGINIYVANSLVFVSAWNVPNRGTGSPWTWKGVSGAVAANTTYIVTMVMNGNTTITGTITGYLNGASLGSAANVGRLYTHTGATGVGRRNGATRVSTGVLGANSPLAGDILEIVYYKSTALTNTDRNKIESYLAIKYGVTLNQTVPTDYVNAAGTVVYAASTSHSVYNNDIAGIGIDNTSALSQAASRSLNADDIVTMSTASAMANNEFLVWGNNNDDNGIIAEIATGVPGTTTTRLDRVWRVDQEGDVGTVTLSFNLTGIAVTGTTAANFGLLIDTGDSNFTAGARMQAAASFAGNVVTFTGVDFSGDDYFTLATNIVQPSVTMSLVPTTIGETGGTTVATVSAILNGPWHSTVTTNFAFAGGATGGGVDYTASASSVVITAGSVVTGSFTVTSVNDLLAEGIETTQISISSVVNGTENGVQQAILTITDDELVNNACLDSEQVFSTELASGDVNVYSLFGNLQSVSTSAYPNNYEMIIDPANLRRYLASYSGQKITRSLLDGSSETVLWDVAGTNPFQMAIDPDRNKIYWTEWGASTNIMCANLDGTGTPVAIATGQYYPSGMQIDAISNTLYVYSGLNTPPDLKKAVLPGNCGVPTFTTVLSSASLPLAYNLTIDPTGSRLFFVDYNANNIVKINTDGTGLNLTLWPAAAPGDQLRDIIYNKNTDELYWIYTNGVIQKALADGTGTVTTLVSGVDAQPDSRSIDICVDSVAPRLTSFTSTSSNGTYCPGSTISVTATYDETIEVGSTLTVVLNTGASVVLNNRVGFTLSGTYTVGATGSGQNSTDLSVSSISSEAVSDSNNNTRTNSTVPVAPNNIADTSNIIVDTAAPALLEVTPVTNPTINRNPPYTFSSDQTGGITYGGACSGVTTAVTVGSNTINLASDGSGNPLSDGLYSNCTLTVLDTPACNSATLNISPFRIAGTIPSVTLSINNSNFNENGGTAIVTATLSNTYALPVTVNLGFTGTASGGDYSSSTPIIIPALSTSNTMTLTGLDDLISEGDETVIIDITSVTNGTEPVPQQVTSTIIDDDTPLVTLSVDNPTISESAGVATFTATLSTTSVSTVTVTLGFTGTATNLSDYTRSSTSISILPGLLTGSVTVNAVDDPDYEVDETVIVDITGVTNAAEAGPLPQQRTTTIEDDQVCSYDPMPVPSGLTAMLNMTIDSSFDPNAEYIPLSGDDFDVFMGRDAQEASDWHDVAVDFFLDTYGVDFSGGNTADGGNVVLKHEMFDPLYNARLHSASGYRIVPSGGTVRSGTYTMVVVGAATTFTGTWGGAGTLVPNGTIVEFGEYAIDLTQPCKDYDGDMETDEITETIYLAFNSTRPNLADFIAYNGAFFMDIPAIIEYDLTTGDGITTYRYTSGKIEGRKELRQINNNLVTTNGNIVVTIP